MTYRGPTMSDPVESRPTDGGTPGPGATRSGSQRWDKVISGVITSALALALGFAFVVQIRSTEAAEERIGATEEDLVRILDELDTREEALRSQLSEREQAVEELSGGRTQSGSALAEAQRRAEAIGVLNGTLMARGPGLRVVIQDREGAVTTAVLLDAIQELRGAGAEAIEVDGVRVIASSYVSGTPGELTVDGTELEAPYEIVAIGPPTDLEVALNVSGGVVDDVARAGASATVTQSDELRVESVVRGG